LSTRAQSKVLEKLKNCSPAFMEEIDNVERRLFQKEIANGRLLELELICAGKVRNTVNLLEIHTNLG
jgi:hypothetical protein